MISAKKYDFAVKQQFFYQSSPFFRITLTNLKKTTF